MRLKTKIILAAIPASAAIVVGTVLVIRLHLNERKHTHDFLPEEARGSLRELCSLKGDDFVPDGFGTSVYQRKLESLSDRQLVAVYVTIKLAETLRARGVDFHQMSKAELALEAQKLHADIKDKSVRHYLLKQLGSIGVETALSILNDGLMIASVGA